jgi:monoamine oxidase
MRTLVAETGIETFAQHTDGAFLVERSQREPPQRYARGYNTEPRSMRLVGGMRSLAEAVASGLPPSTVQCHARVKSISLDAAGGVHIDATSAAGSFILEAEAAILALPPRLASRSIRFAPNLPQPLLMALDAVPTWMAAHAKVVAIYDRPFWRAQGYSGSATSNVGPLAEVHDASPADGYPALFGFVGLPAAARNAIGSQDLKRLALAQLVRLFGHDAAQPIAVHLLDWASEPDTATPEDCVPPDGHPSYGSPPEVGETWQRRLAFAGTEVAPYNGGYLEGALEAAVAAVDGVFWNRIKARDPTA